jgi:hypothetical protein
VHIPTIDASNFIWFELYTEKSSHSSTGISFPISNDSDSSDVAFDIGNEIPVDEWDDFSVYNSNHMKLLASIVGICTLKRDYVNIGYYAERFRPEKALRHSL